MGARCLTFRIACPNPLFFLTVLWFVFPVRNHHYSCVLSLYPLNSGVNCLDQPEDHELDDWTITVGNPVMHNLHHDGL